MGRKLLKIVQTITTFRNFLADPMGSWEPVADPLWSADPSLKTAGPYNVFVGSFYYFASFSLWTHVV